MMAPQCHLGTMCDDVEWFSPDSSIAIWFCFVFKDFELKQCPLLEHPLLDPFSVIEQVSVTGKPLIGQVETPSFGEVYNYRCKTTLTIVHFIREPGKESPFDRLFFNPPLTFHIGTISKTNLSGSFFPSS